MAIRKIAILFFFISFGTLSAHAGAGPAYVFGEQWWSEYASDKGTNLLLHFGPAQVAGNEKVKAGIERKKQDEDLISSSDFDNLQKNNKDDKRVQTIGKKDFDLPPIDEAGGRPGQVLDYSDKRRKIDLPAGFKVDPGAGFFGAGLICDGSGALRITVHEVESVEAWIKVETYPAKDSCVFSLEKDESRLLLRADGKLEYRLKKPHGEFDRTKLSEPAIQALMLKNAEIVSPQKFPLNTWTHVIVRKQHHAMPGGGEPWDAKLVINGDVVAGYQSERFNRGGNYMGDRTTGLVVGNSADGTQGFKGTIDELRVSSMERVFYERPVLAWRDATAARALQFNRPSFRNDNTAFQLSFDKALGFSFGGPAFSAVNLDLKNQKLDDLLVEGVRGKALLIDPAIDFLKVSVPRLNARAGALEFWVRPVNWDDVTGYWQHSPPINKDLSIARIFARTKGKETVAFNVTLPRAFNLERHRVPVDPGHWLHLVLVWDLGGWGLYCDDRVISGARRDPKDSELELSHVEFGVNTPAKGKHGEVPRIEIDEIVGYNGHLLGDEVAQAHKRWMGALEPIALYQVEHPFKYSLQKLEFNLRPLLPESVKPSSAVVTLFNATTDAPVTWQTPMELAADGKFHALINDGKKLPFGKYRFDFKIFDQEGKTVIKASKDWNYEEEPWRNSTAGILDKVPAPWKPIAFDGKSLETRMTRYSLGADGLPAEIFADGVNLLSGPMQFLEDGKALTGAPVIVGEKRETDASWSGKFSGASCDVKLDCRAEYDGMIRYEIRVIPKAGVKPLRLDIPIDKKFASHFIAHPMGSRGVFTSVLPAKAGSLVSTKPAEKEAFGFWGHCDINDRNRGLWWFCDNAAGWGQSKKIPAIDVVREGESVVLRLNLIAEAGAYSESKPIVFAILPHPARPLPEKYRLFERCDPKVDAMACSIFDAFLPWPTSPRSGGESLNMTLYPATDPAKPEAGPSWDFAASCIPMMKATKLTGYRTLYLSRAWFSCRAGAYDNWEWRSGEMSAASLNKSFNNYLCWEMNEWIGRGIFNAIYLDECYETPARNLEAGYSVKLPDGSEQAGVTNFAFRDLMKRWRGIFHQHGLEPMIMGHHTYSFQYPGLLYCDAILDGENYPIVSLNSADWIDSVPLHKYENTQSARMWGVTPFWMPFVAEGGFDNKSKSGFLKWQWRMARQAQSVFAHFEIATCYENQGAQVHKAFWKDAYSWGAADPKIPFVHYWNAAPALTVVGQGKDALVSYYQGNGKILVIASNRLTKEATLKIKLDFKALGLKPGAAVRVLDSGAKPPAGSDFVKGQLQAEIKAMEKDGPLKLGEEKEKPVGDAFDLVDEKAEKLKAFAPRLDGETLVLPVHARDFRMISIE